MKKLVLTALMSASVFGLSAKLALADFDLNILHINDLHSRIEAINKYDSTCSADETAKNECFGGFARVKTAIDEKKAALSGTNLLVLDAGDQFQGSLFYNQYKSGLIAELMNKTGFDAMALGNHEFDDGPDELLKFLDAVQFPIISGNTMAGDSSPLKDKIKPYIIKEFGSEKVAVVSVLATDTDETSSPGDKILFGDEIAYLKTAVAELTAQGINKIVLLSHVGYVKDQEIAAKVDGIDVIVGGHSHTLLSNSDPKALGPYPTLVKNPAGVDVPIVTAYAYSKYLGEIKVTFDDNGTVKAASGQPNLLDHAITPNAEIAARISELAKPLEEIKRKEVGSTTTDIDGSRENCRARECTMGNFVADASLDRVKNQGITIALQNGGNLRASIKSGTVTMGDVLTVLPFQNTLATFQLKGSDIRKALENGASKIEEGAGRFVQVAGMRYSFDKSKPAGQRIVSAEVKEGDNFQPLDDNKTYGVVANNYLRSGGDGFDVLASSAINPYDFGPSMEDAVAQYLTTNSPYTPKLEGRITEVGADAATSSESAATSGSAAPSTSEPAAATTSDQYTVKRGDSLWKIATQTYGDGEKWSAIARENSLGDPDLIHPGDALKLPAKQ